MDGAKFVIQQVVHGYNEGHSMLASSCDLSQLEKLALLKMSDLSGSISGDNFAPYLTGYPLTDSNYYALAKTWNAPEMKRPGCVWTHTLLISFPDLGRMKDFRQLDNLFVKPDTRDLKRYSAPLTYRLAGSDSFSLNRDKFDQLAYFVYQNPRKIVLVDPDFSFSVDNDILSLWSYQWPRLRRSFSFCTGSFAIRVLNDKPLDVQVIPRQTDFNPNLKNTKSEFVVLKQDQTDIDAAWFQMFKQANLEDMLAFMFTYGSDVEGTRDRFISLFLAFIFEQQIKLFDNKLLQVDMFFNQNFPKRGEAKTFKRDILLKLFKIDKKNEYYFLLQKLNSDEENTSLLDISIEYSRIIEDLWISKTISKIELAGLFKTISLRQLGDEAFLLLARLPVDSWMNAIWMSEDVVVAVAHVNKEIADETSLWSYGSTSQSLWVRGFMMYHAQFPGDGILARVVTAMIKVHHDEFAGDLVNRFKEEPIMYALQNIKDSQNVLPARWEKLTLQYPETVLEWVKQMPLTRYKMVMFLKVLPKGSKALNEVLKDWNVLIKNIERSGHRDLIHGVFSWVLSYALKNSIKDSGLVSSLVFQRVHDVARTGNLEDEYWAPIWRSLPKDYTTTPEVGFISKAFGLTDGTVPSWDRCEILRRSIVECYILYKWDPTDFFAQ